MFFLPALRIGDIIALFVIVKKFFLPVVQTIKPKIYLDTFPADMVYKQHKLKMVFNINLCGKKPPNN